MSTVTISPEKVYEVVLKAVLREEHELKRVEQAIVSEYRKWWNNWMYKNYTDEEIVGNSIRHGFQRADIAMNIEKLQALRLMCIHAIQEGTMITLCRKDYELIYGDN